MTVSSHSTPSATLGGAEVSARAERRRFTVEYKTRNVQEAVHCRAPGEIGSLLRREGQVSTDCGELDRLQRDHAQLQDHGTRRADDGHPQKTPGAAVGRADRCA